MGDSDDSGVRMYVHVCQKRDVCVRVYVCMYTHIYIYIYIYIYMNTHILTHTYIYAIVGEHYLSSGRVARLCAYVCKAYVVCKRPCVHASMNQHLHKDTHVLINRYAEETGSVPCVNTCAHIHAFHKEIRIQRQTKTLQRSDRTVCTN